jgi:hypothetical protein
MWYDTPHTEALWNSISIIWRDGVHETAIPDFLHAVGIGIPCLWDETAGGYAYIIFA